MTTPTTPPVSGGEEVDRLRAQLLEFVTASLEHDYTVDHDCPEYADDAAEQAAALANILEMHRLLTVRQERLSTAHAEIDRLRAENEHLQSVKTSLHKYVANLQASIDKALVVCDAGEWQATRWEQPFPVPSWVTDIRAALSGVSETPEASDG